MRNIIAMIYDFDKTLSPDYMQRPMLDARGIDEKNFWSEKEKMCDLHLRDGLNVERDTAYLHHIILQTRNGEPLEGLTQAALREYGSKLRLYPGLPEFFPEIKKAIEEDPKYKAFEIRIEHYVASTGLMEMLRGSAVAPYMKAMEACEFFYDENKVPIGVAKGISNTQKTEMLFKIHKGVYDDKMIDVNSSIPEDLRRVSFENMIYFGDGPSDVPCMSIVKGRGGFTMAVYDPDAENVNFVKNPMRNAYDLHQGNRVHAIAPADYNKDSHLFLFIKNVLTTISDRIVQRSRDKVRRSLVALPGHHDFYDEQP